MCKMEKLLMGVARKDITPEIGGQLYGYSPDVRSCSVEDALNVTAFYFRQGRIQALMITATVCLIQTKLDADIRNMIEEKYSIPASNCMISATHTHSGPNTCGHDGWGDIDQKYCKEIFIPSILAAVDAVRGYNKIRSFEDVELRVSEKELNIPLKNVSARQKRKDCVNVIVMQR